VLDVFGRPSWRPAGYQPATSRTTVSPSNRIGSMSLASGMLKVTYCEPARL
jgi:hypothetical protein